MAFFKFIVWTACAIAIGVGLASFELDGRTPIEHADRAWEKSGGAKKAKQMASSVGDRAGDAYDSARERLKSKNAAEPHEAHTEEDRAAVDALITQRTQKK